MRYSLLLLSFCLTVVVQAQEPPFADDDDFSTFLDSTLTIDAPGVLENDFGDDTIIAILETPPSDGTLSLASDGSFVYTPNPGFSGVDRFTYVAETGNVPERLFVDPSRSGARMFATLDVGIIALTEDDSSAISGRITSDLVPNNEPFGQIQLTSLDLALSQSLSLTFDFGILGSVNVDTDPDSLAFALASPGPAVVVSDGSFSQIDNQLSLAGTLNVSGSLAGSGAGPQKLDVTVPADINGIIVQNGSDLQIEFPLQAEGSFDVDGNTVTVNLQGSVVATGPVIVPLTSNVAEVTIVVAPVGVGTDEPSNVESKFALGQNFPNPADQFTSITYEIPTASEVSIAVYDALGREVVTLVNGIQSAGTHRADLDASVLPVGLYLYRLRAGSHTDMKKLIIVR